MIKLGKALQKIGKTNGAAELALFLVGAFVEGWISGLGEDVYKMMAEKKKEAVPQIEEKEND